MIKISELKKNPNNPRLIKDDKFHKLVHSIKDFPQMMELRPIIINDDNIVLGGNMRLAALKELGYKDVPDEWVKKASDLTPEQQNEFIIKDNVGYGEWDWEILANEWESEQLKEWGLDLPVLYNPDDINLDSFFEESNEEKDQKNKIILEYTEDDYNLVIDAFTKHQGSKEQIVFKLLGL